MKCRNGKQCDPKSLKKKQGGKLRSQEWKGRRLAPVPGEEPEANE